MAVECTCSHVMYFSGCLGRTILGMNAQAIAPARLLSIRETLRILGISRTTLYAIFASGELETVEIRGRRMIEPAELKDYIARNRRRGGSEIP
jgi:hypothetical protein